MFKVGERVRDNGKGYPKLVGTERIGKVIPKPDHAMANYIWVRFSDMPDGDKEWFYTEDELVKVEG